MLSGLFNKKPNQDKQNWISFKLLKAIETDDIETLNLYLTTNSKDAAALNASNIYGQTLLMLTILSRNSRLTIKALKQPLVDVNAVAKNGECAITIAMSCNDPVTIEYLLDRENLNLQQHGPALFSWAVECGFENIITRLAKHTWFIAFREKNPAFTDKLLEAALAKRQFKTLYCLIKLALVNVNNAITAIVKHSADSDFHEAIDQEQEFMKFLLCHQDTDFAWRELLAHNSDVYLILSKLEPDEIRFVVAHQDIRIKHMMLTVVNPDAFIAKSAYMDKLCLTLTNPDNSVCCIGDLLTVLLQLQSFNRDMVIADNKTTNDLLREGIIIELSTAIPPAREETSEDDEELEEIVACRLI